MGKPYTDGYGQSDYPPVCFSAVGRAWLPRRQLAGTYDDAWLKTQWPLPPLDFDDGYWNCAPQDQQVPHLPVGVQILLADLYSNNQAAAALKSADKGTDKGTTGEWRGKLPKHQLWMGLLTETKVQIKDQTVDQSTGNVAWKDMPMLLDTLVMDLATQQIYATYRLRLAAEPQASGTSLKEMHTVLTLGKPDQHVPIEDMGLLG
jgi:Uncharacterized protein conserved in bacteria (DUF2169)